MTQSDRIYLASPNMNGSEIGYINSAFEKNRIAPYGENLELFEEQVRNFIGVSSSVAVSSGTAGIHMGLMYLGVGPGDIVFCSDATFSASCNPIKYLSAEPCFIDSDEKTWNISPAALKKAFEDA